MVATLVGYPCRTFIQVPYERPSMRPSLREISPTPWLDHLEERATAMQANPDADSVHDLRVACGRLIVWLDFGRWRVLRDDLRWLRRSAATVRDLDVALERFANRPWAADLAAQRSLGASDLQRVLAHPRVQGIVQALAAMPAASEEAAVDLLAALQRRTLRAGKRLGHPEKDLGEVHKLRRSVRRLRYVLEWIDAAPQELADLQTELGALNDLVVTGRILSGHANEDGVAADRAVVEKELGQQCGRVRDTWEDAREMVESL